MINIKCSFDHTILDTTNKTAGMLFPEDMSICLEDGVTEDGFIMKCLECFKSLKTDVLKDINYFLENTQIDLFTLPDYKITVQDVQDKFTLSRKKLYSKEERIIMGDSINGEFEKNILIKDYHTEKYRMSIQKSFTEDMTNTQYIKRMLKLSSLAEKAVYIAMCMDGTISKEDEEVKKRFICIENKIKYASLDDK